MGECNQIVGVPILGKATAGIQRNLETAQLQGPETRLALL